MKTGLLKCLLLGFLGVALVAVSAHAIPIEVDFTVTGFSSGAPTDPVTGTIIYDAASPTANINSLTSINLTIAGHSYSLGEVGFISPFGTQQAIGGILNGVNAVIAHTTDFSLFWNEASLHPVEFAYATPSTFIFTGSDFTSFSVTAVSAVPEPSTMLLLGSGLIGLAGYGRKKLFKK